MAAFAFTLVLAVGLQGAPHRPPDVALVAPGAEAPVGDNELRKLATAVLDGRDNATLDAFAVALGRAANPLAQPRMIVSHFCAMSSVTTNEVRELIRRSGVGTYPAPPDPSATDSPGTFELSRNCALNPELNANCTWADGAPADAYSLAHAMVVLAARAVLSGSTLVFKAMAIDLAPRDGISGHHMTTEGEPMQVGIGETLAAMGTRAVIMWRAGTLDVGICGIKDCFKQTQDIGFLLSSNGEALDCSDRGMGGRRSAEGGDELRVQFSPLEALAPWLETTWQYTSTEMSEILAEHGWRSTPGGMPATGSSRAFSTGASSSSSSSPSPDPDPWLASVLTAEDLFAYEYENATDADFEVSVSAWGASLTSLGIDPNVSAIRAYLGDGRASFHRAPQSEEIANFEEVAEVLRQAGPPYSEMISRVDGDKRGQ